MLSQSYHLLGSAHIPISCVQVLAEKLAWSMAEELSIDLVTIHPALVLGCVYYPNDSPVSIQFMKVRRQSCQR